MNITLIRRKWSSTGGAENYLLRLARQLQKNGHQVTLICERWDRDQQKDFFSVIEIPVKTFRAYEPLEFAKQANAFLENHSSDCILSLERGIRSHIYRAGDGAHRVWLAQRQKFRPVIGRFQNFFNLKNKIVCQLEKFSFDTANTQCVIANSEMVRKSIMEYFVYPTDSIKIVRNGVDVAYFSSGNREEGRKALNVEKDDFVILLVGAGKERKGHRYARKVAQKLGNHAKLVIVDRPQACPMPSIYAAADIFLLPTLYDPSANVTLEAMAAKLPVITTADNGASEIIQHRVNGFVVPHAKEVIQMTEIAQNLMRNPQFRAQIGTAAYETVADHTLEKNVQETISICENFQKRPIS